MDVKKRKPYNFCIFQGEDVKFSTVYKDSDGAVIDITGYTARLQARTSYEDDSDPAPVALSSSPGVVIAGAEGKVTFFITNAQTSGLTPGEYVYDAELIDGSGLVTKLLFGKIEVLPEVTK